jgi:predicted AlkP superfamily phosphohydrolase/phosphomutase
MSKTDLGTRIGYVTRRRRVLVVGADGADPQIVARLIGEGKLPHLARLCAEGRWGPLRTTFPPVSPVAWMTCLTGVSPAVHGVHDFLVKAQDSYLPTIGLFQVSAGSDGLPVYHSQCAVPTLGEILAEAGRTAYILQVPGTFPPPTVQGGLLAGFGMPDLLGTFGVSAWYTTDPEGKRAAAPEGRELVHSLEPLDGGLWIGRVAGPAKASCLFTLRRDGSRVVLSLAAEAQRPVAVLEAGDWSGWVRLPFSVPGRGLVEGICRFKLVSSGTVLSLYRTAVQCTPDRPLYPLSEPPGFSARLFDLVGPYATVGMPSDMDGVRRGVVDLGTFLQDAYANWKRQVEMALGLMAEGAWDLLFVHLFTIDNAQHLFWKYQDPRHPGYGAPLRAAYRTEIEHAYRWVDAQVGHLVEQIGDDTTVIVVSDHGGVPIYRLAYLNAWLAAGGYLVPREHVQTGETARLDWDRTRAAMYGTGGIWLNVQGREPRGIVPPGAPYEALRDEIARALLAWRDPESGEPVVARVLRREQVYGGGTGPDLTPALRRGYGLGRGEGLGRVMVGRPPIVPNESPWSGGHEGPYLASDARGIVALWGPGVQSGDVPARARLHDIAPTVLSMLGVSVPGAMEGQSLLG